MRRLLLCGVSCLVFGADQLQRVWRRLWRQASAGTLVVLEYHSISLARRQAFARQLDAMLRLAKPLPADADCELDAGERYFAVTFDDGLISFKDNALPELQARSVPSAVFIVTNRLGAVPGWVSYSSGGRATERMMRAEELRTLPRDVLIGAHGRTHADLTRVERADADREIAQSKAELEAVIGAKVTSFCFPYGAHTWDIIEQCRVSGYERVFTNVPVLAVTARQEFVRGRVHASPDETLLEVRLKVCGAYRWLPMAFNMKRWVVRALARAGVRRAEVAVP